VLQKSPDSVTEKSFIVSAYHNKMCCSVLQRANVCCSVLQCHGCSVLQCVLQGVAV